MLHSLQSSQIPVILLLTPDVPGAIASLIRNCGSRVAPIVVDYIYGNPSLFKKDWFREVFTKLHIFNQVTYERVIFLDLDMVVRDPADLRCLFDLLIDYGAMENSKSWSSGSMILDHGQRMGKKCGLINAGLIFCKPDRKLFDMLVSDVTSESAEHVPGMTPEQFYLARVMGEHFCHISQRFNFEVQLHGGVPLTDRWRRLEFEDVTCFHFSGGSPLDRIKDLENPEWGCQTEKKMIAERWFNEISESTRKIANERARLAFGLWAKHFALACKQVRTCSECINDDWLGNLLQFGHREDCSSLKGDLLVGDVVEDNLVVIVERERFLLVNPESLELSWHMVKRVPSRPPPRLPRYDS